MTRHSGTGPGSDGARSSRAVAVTGAGGSGAVTAGLILLDAVASAGFYALLSRSAGPQIRGGESAAMLRFGPTPVRCPADRFDMLVALDWRNYGRFSDELPLDAGTVVLADPDAGDPPAVVAASGARLLGHAFRASAQRRSGGRANMVAVGACGARLGLPLHTLLAGATRALADKGTAVVEGSRACIAAGYREASDAGGEAVEQPEESAAGRPTRWNISGNEAAGLGALRAGVRFVAAYPITPASEMLEWLAPRIEQVGGALLQAEDELASINMIIGSSFGGVPALTATSGPGFSLMVEGIGLAVASETPVVVVDVMRGGPSTGIPTKSEQADLEIALYGLHGDAPHLVLAALDVADCAYTVDWATRLAERLQTAAVVLSDQSLGQSRAVVDPPVAIRAATRRRTAQVCEGRYRRYAPTTDGVSPMARPGTVGCLYTAEGLEHNARGVPSSVAADHRAQLDKRRRKLDGADYGPGWAEIDGAGDLCLVTWGSCRGAVVEAAERLRSGGHSIGVVALRLLAPLRCEALRAAIGAARVLVVEQNHSGQLFRYLHAEQALPGGALSLARPGPLPLRPGEIVAEVERAFAIDADGLGGGR